MSQSRTSTAEGPVVLLVEDNDNDVELARLAFMHAGINASLHCVGDGEQCMAYLRDPDPARLLPRLILLDLHMPRMSGLEVLAAVAQDMTLRRIPIVVLTTSDAPEDVAAAYRYGCKSYVLKPFGFESFVDTLTAVCRYWLELTTLPTAAIEVCDCARTATPAVGAQA